MPNPNPFHRRPGAFVALVLVYLAVFTFATRHYFMDDAYIGFRFADNALRGRGLVFNPGDRVEAISNIGWILFLIPGGLFVGIPLLAKLLGILCLTGSLFLLTRITDGPEQGTLLAMPCAPILVCLGCFPLMYFCSAGMETGLLAFLLTLIVYLAARDRENVIAPVLCAFAFLVHPEAVAIYPAASLLILVAGLRPRRSIFGGLALFTVLVGSFTAARWIYYGQFLPNTFHAKPADPGQILQRLQELLAASLPNIPFPYSGFLGLGLMAWGTRCLARARPIFAIYAGVVCSAGLAFGVYARPDWTVLPRYGAPYVPIMALVSWCAVTDLLRRIPTGGLVNLPRQAGALVLIFWAGSGIADTHRNLLPDSTETYPGYVVFGETLEEPSRWIGNHTAATAVVATRRIGALAYFSDRRIFDYRFGLSDPRVTALFGPGHDLFDTPSDPALKALWLKESPDYLLEDLDVIAGIAGHGPKALADFTVHGIHYHVERMFLIGRNARWVLCRR